MSTKALQRTTVNVKKSFLFDMDIILEVIFDNI